MRKIWILTFVAGACFVLLLPTKAHGIEEFDKHHSATYTLDSRGGASVIETLTLKNNLAHIYPKEYILSLSNLKLIDPTVKDANNQELPSVYDETNNTITISFPNPNLGKNKENSFVLSYRLTNFAINKGSIWELILPFYKDQGFASSSWLKLKIPTSYGILAYTSKMPNSKIQNEGDYQVFYYQSADIQKNFLLAFGQYQYFSFTLQYYLKNQSEHTATKTITLPPDTHQQKVYYQNITPNPDKIEVDTDGNWVAAYTLTPNQILAIVVKGQARIGPHQEPIPQSTKPPSDNLAESTFWPLHHPDIQRLTNTLTTPRAIYNFVVTTLEYQNPINPNSIRKGALLALADPKNSLCTEFTDLFVTLTRAVGIPSREIEGFAYTDNTKIKPVLAGDILHAWPEYFNKDTGQWIPVDPTWEKSTGGVNYFDHLDLNHLVFVIHGSNSTEPPPPGSFRRHKDEKTVDVSFSADFNPPQLLPPRVEKILSFSFSSTSVLFSNPNLQTLPPHTLSVSHAKALELPTLPPLGTHTMTISHPPWPKILLPKYRRLLITSDNQTSSFSFPPYYFYLSVSIALVLVLFIALLFLVKKVNHFKTTKI